MRYTILVIILFLFGIADNVFSVILAASTEPNKIITADSTAKQEHMTVQEAIEVSCQKSCDDNDACTADRCESGTCVNEIMRCSNSSATCPDGFVAACGNICTVGKCSKCTPSCASEPTYTPTPTPTPSPTPCIANWQCDTTMCINDKQTKTCTDDNGCLPAATETQNCVSLNHVIFSEVFYDTPGNESDEEWLKLYNPSNGDADMTNWSITDNSGTWKFTGTINSKSYLTIARNAGGFKNLTGCNANIAGFSRGLNNDGDQLALKNMNGVEVDFVAWEKGANNAYPLWNITAAEGKSIKRISLTADMDSVSDWITGEAKPC